MILYKYDALLKGCTLTHKCIFMRKICSSKEYTAVLTFPRFYFIKSNLRISVLFNKNCRHVCSNLPIDESSGKKSIEETEKNPVSLLGSGLMGRAIKLDRIEQKKRIRAIPDPKPEDSLPISVKMMIKSNPSKVLETYPELSKLVEDTHDINKENKEELPVRYPYSSSSLKDFQKISMETEKPFQNSLVEDKQEFDSFINFAKSKGQKLTEEEIDYLREHFLQSNLGTPDSSLPISNIICGGCGSYFHCKDPALPGYLPSETFIELSGRELAHSFCQRCTFIQNFNIALKVNVHASDYERIISEIKHKVALVLLMVDLTDFPCSIWPNLLNIIGPSRAIYVIGNKVDLLPCDDRGYLERVKLSLRASLKDYGFHNQNSIEHVSLISAKTGYGVEGLITKLQNSWKKKGDVFLVGCTNVGKSTLFNALLQSDYCNVKALDTIQRATVSVWPGTTLNLLKFPISGTPGWRLYLRTQRLIQQAKFNRQEEELRKTLYKESGYSQHATLIGHVGMTFKDGLCKSDSANLKPNEKESQPTPMLKGIFDPEHENYVHGRFFYDTPGAVYEDQILDILTTEELIKVLPKEIIQPRTYLVRPLQTLFLAGLARVDVLEANHHIYVTVFASSHLPIHLVYTEEADLFYKKNLGTDLLGVPCGSNTRLKDFPELKSKDIYFEGIDFKTSCGDIVLSSAGWISVTVARNDACVLKAYTPDGRGCHVRKPSMLCYAINLKGRRITGTPAFQDSRVSVKR